MSQVIETRTRSVDNLKTTLDVWQEDRAWIWEASVQAGESKHDRRGYRNSYKGALLSGQAWIDCQIAEICKGGESAEKERST